MQTTTAKNKSNNSTLECIQLSTSTKLLLKLEREKTYFELSGLQR